MATTEAVDWMRSPTRREARVDVLRGIALLCIFVDHIPDDVLNAFTLRNYGFSDAAEIFVMLAGFACLMAYGRSFANHGITIGLRKILLRCARIYLFQMGLMVVVLAIVWLWNAHFHLEPTDLVPMLQRQVHTLIGGLTLRSQPSNLNILPLYIVLLGIFPAIYAGLRANLKLTLVISVGVWALSNIYPGLNLTNTFDGGKWFFDPFSWQLIFVIGAALAVVMAKSGGNLPTQPWLFALAWVFLAVSLLQASPWTNFGFPSLAPFSMNPPDKTHLAPLRLVHAIALVYVVLCWRMPPSFRRSTLIYAIEVCGKHSLEVFSAGTVLALLGRLAFTGYGNTWAMQVLVNLVGFATMTGLGHWLERARHARGVAAPMVKPPSTAGGTVI
jgi:hypothetical protein